MGERPQKNRLDQELVARGLVVSRARAADLIRRGEVQVDGVTALKPAMPVSADSTIALTPGAGAYVSRGALKLRPALGRFGFDAAGRACLDIGASTGGFTEVILQAGARRVYAVDNGQGQLHPILATDPRVVSLEATDARMLDRMLIPEPVTAIVADVSFISLRKALPAASRLAAAGCWLIALVKPQFEAEPGIVRKDGTIVDPEIHASIVARVESWLAAQPGWRIVGLMASPVKGGDGNTEFLMGAVYDG
jgi:23S rRNA (cytidine1920-2'-O)/16S rRNA (cytidine1409-2'-O)-methyltransferase